MIPLLSELNPISVEGIVADVSTIRDAVSTTDLTNEPRFTRFPTITSAGGAAATEVVRLASDGVLAKAQADTAAHAAGILGVWDGTRVLPFSLQPVAKFDSTPLLGQPCYLSRTVAGALTSTVPPAGTLSVPCDLMVAKVLSSTTATVVKSPLVPALNKEGTLTARALALTGIDPSRARVLWDDFEKIKNQNEPNWGVYGTHPTQLEPSIFEVGTTGFEIRHPCVLRNAQITSQKFYFRVRIKLRDLAYGFFFGLYRSSLWNLTDSTEKIALTNRTGDLTHFCYWHPGASPEFVDVGSTETDNWHTYEAWSAGDGSYSEQFDSVGVSTRAMTDAMVPNMVGLEIEGRNAVDYVILVSESEGV